MRRIRRDGSDTHTALVQGFGGEWADRLIRAATRVKLREIRSEVRKERVNADGVITLWAPPRTARATFELKPIREANSLCVRRMALVWCQLASWLGPNGRTGHRAQGHRLNVAELAKRAGSLDRPLSVREVERYLAAFESAGLIKRWQPPKSSGAPKGTRSGHCFNLYALPAGKLPPQLEKQLQRFHAAWWPRAARAEPAAPPAIAPGTRGPIGEAGAAALAELRRRGLGPPD